MADVRVLLDRLFAKRDGGNAEQQVLDVRQVDANGVPVGAGGAPTLTTATVTSVADANADTLLLAANANRKPGSAVVNDSTAILYINLGAAASATACVFAIDGKTTVPGVYYVPDGWLGTVRGFWAADTAGSARVLEFV